MTLVEYRAWKEAQEKEIESKGQELARTLIESVPPSLEKWKAEAAGWVVDSLIKYGRCSTKYRPYNLDIYGFTSLRDCKRKIDSLALVWPDVTVTTHLFTGSNEVVVVFSV